MNVLATEDDKLILNEAFAFIEACQGETFPAGVSATDDSDDVPPLDDLIDEKCLELLDVPTAGLEGPVHHEARSTCQQLGKSREGTMKPKPTKKRRVRSAETSSTALQRRKRAELATLREQVEELEDVLAELKRTGVHPLAPGGQTGLRDGFISNDHTVSRSATQVGQAEWYHRAIEQYRLRLQAEKTNRHLKVIRKNQTKANEAMCGILQKRSVLYGMNYLMNNEVPRFGGVLSGMSHLDVWLAKLEQATEALHHRSSAIFELIEQPIAVSTSMECKYDERRRMKTIEFKTHTPLNCSLQEASSFVWRDFQADRALGRKPNSLQKKVALTMPSRNGDINAEKLHFMRKDQDAAQTSVSWADVMVLPTKRELQFRTEGLVLLTCSRANPDQAESRSFLKLYLDSSNASSPPRPEDLAYAQDVVLGAMALKLRMYWQSFQNMLLERAGSVSNQIAV